MAHRTKPPFRADHVGSLLRPRSIPDSFKRYVAGDLEEVDFIGVQDAAICDVIKFQEDVGLQPITDGEFRRASYWSRFVERVEGFDVREALFSFHDNHGHEKNFTAPHVAGKVKRSEPLAVDEFEFVKAHTSQTPKITLPSPPSMHFWRLNQGIDTGVYLDQEAYFTDLAAVYREEIADLAAHGATYIQLDDVPFPMLCDAAVRDQVRKAGLDPDKLLRDYIQLCNECLRDRPAGITAAIHLCRGNYKGHFLSQGGYEAIAEEFFNELKFDAFFLEYDTPRAGHFAPLRNVPNGKIVVLGLISSKIPELEAPDDIKRRIDDAAANLNLDQLCLSPQCGFASTIAGNPITVDNQKEKLSLVVEVAAAVWG